MDWALGVSLLITVLLRLPSLFEPYWYGDEAIYLTIGLALPRRLLLYRDVYDNKPPLIYLLAALVNGSLFGAKFLLLISQLLAVWGIWRLTQKSKIAVLLFAILSSLPFLEGNIFNAELLILTLIIWAAVFLQAASYFWAGLLWGLAVATKLPAFLVGLPLVFLLCSKSQKAWLQFLAGFSLVWATIIGFFLATGAFLEFTQSVFWDNLAYLSSWETGQFGAPLWRGTLGQRIGLLLVAIGGIYWLIKQAVISQKDGWLLIWFFLSLFAATLSARPYPHYLLLVLPPGVLLASRLVCQRQKTSFWLTILAFWSAAVVYWHFHFWRYPTIAYYQRFFNFATEKISFVEYLADFDPQTPINYRLANWLQTVLPPSKPLFVWGNRPQLYALSRRLPASSFVVAYHVIERQAISKVINDLEKRLPKVVLVFANEAPVPGKLNSWLVVNCWPGSFFDKGITVWLCQK